MMRPLTANDISSATFGAPGRGRLGYDAGTVDAFLTRAAGVLDSQALGRPAAMSTDEVHQVRFRVARRGMRYDQDQVDAFLERLSTTLDDPGRATGQTGLDGQPLRP